MTGPQNRVKQPGAIARRGVKMGDKTARRGANHCDSIIHIFGTGSAWIAEINAGMLSLPAYRREDKPYGCPVSRVTIVGSYIVALVMDMERLPVEGETVTGRNFHTTHGGKGSNMAVAAARLGAEVHFLGKIGRDSHGQAFLALLQEEGVGARGVMTTDTSPTATGIIFFTDRGTNAIAIDRGANGELTPDDVARQRGLIGVNDIVISPLEISLATARAAAERASQQGGKAILNPAPAQDLRQEDLSAFFALTPNETEARVCLGLAPD